MKRKFTSYQLNNFTEIKNKMLNWLKPFSIFCLLDNNEYNFSEPAFECLVAAGSLESLQLQAGKAFEGLEQFYKNQNDWIFGHMSYDLKNEVENLSSQNFDGIQFPDLFFFVPRIILILKKNILKIGVINEDPDKIFAEILLVSDIIHDAEIKPPEIKSRFTKEEYLSVIKKIQQHILRGDCYEINFCQEFFAENISVDPFYIYKKLTEISPNPFAAFYKVDDKYLVCSSPERFLKRVGNKIFSQPIKGTSKRYLQNPQEDLESKSHLQKSKKEIAENVMVVDLVRNDLGKICTEGSIKADELFKIYSFPQVHQMTSTISGELNTAKSLSEILKATFPMGSMTGAPKKSVMELIEKYERTRRGLYSGAIGYISPEGDFDFNVVIRSILYNSKNKYLSLQAGSAITFYSEAEKEYEECFVKIEAMKKALE